MSQSYKHIDLKANLPSQETWLSYAPATVSEGLFLLTPKRCLYWAEILHLPHHAWIAHKLQTMAIFDPDYTSSGFDLDLGAILVFLLLCPSTWSCLQKERLFLCRGPWCARCCAGQRVWLRFAKLRKRDCPRSHVFQSLPNPLLCPFLLFIF